MAFEFTTCTLIANCSTAGCSNGGTCIHTPDSYVYNCACSSGWTGSLCKTSTSFPSAPCSGSPCQNGGTCLIVLGKSMCICVDSWQGDNCEIRDAVPVGIDCSSYESQCANGACISRFLWCDGIQDCIDGGDEKDCSGSSLDVLDGCKPWQFNCGDGANCVPVESRCNKVKDCDNGADEYGCGYPDPVTDLTGSLSGQCGRLEFRCEDGRCIMGRARCDGNPDCRDGSDERNCASIVQNPPCSVWDFDCGDGSCVDRRGRCDRYPDCQNEADEANCDAVQPKLPSEEPLMPTTPIHTNGRDPPCDGFLCPDGYCIPGSWVCDGDYDCGDYSDEQSNLCPGRYVPCNGFRCSDGFCIRGSWECDGDNDCGDYSDEQNCHTGICDSGMALEHDEYVFTVPTFYPTGEWEPPHVFITTPSRDPVNVTLSIPGLNHESCHTTDRDHHADIPLPIEISLNLGDGKQNVTGIIRSSGMVAVHVIDSESIEGDVFTVYSSSRLGNVYYVATYTPDTSFFCVTALSPDTVVSVKKNSNKIIFIILDSTRVIGLTEVMVKTCPEHE
ncbi:uncharacterized protein [Amphiura filiformis]|uniref:uncharacterized protein n=1 Tax=Amphiura filiformis TaxID=82378 RepID=UPI003B21AD4C